MEEGEFVGNAACVSVGTPDFCAQNYLSNRVRFDNDRSDWHASPRAKMEVVAKSRKEILGTITSNRRTDFLAGARERHACLQDGREGCHKNLPLNASKSRKKERSGSC